MTTYTPLEENSERRSRKQCIGLTLGGVLFSALLISSLVLNAHYIIRNDANQRMLKKQNQLNSQTTVLKRVMKGAAACDGTECPTGCCVGELDWFCCADGQYCAATEDDCPAMNLIKMASMKTKAKKVMKGAAACDGTECPTGCCVGELDWFCCADGQYCAATEDDCPSTNIFKMAKTKKVMKARAKKV